MLGECSSWMNILEYITDASDLSMMISASTHLREMILYKITTDPAYRILLSQTLDIETKVSLNRHLPSTSHVCSKFPETYADSHHIHILTRRVYQLTNELGDSQMIYTKHHYRTAMNMWRILCRPINLILIAHGSQGFYNAINQKIHMFDHELSHQPATNFPKHWKTQFSKLNRKLANIMRSNQYSPINIVNIPWNN